MGKYAGLETISGGLPQDKPIAKKWKRKESPAPVLSFPCDWESWMEYQRYKIFKDLKNKKPSELDPRKTGLHSSFSDELSKISPKAGIAGFRKKSIQMGIPGNYAESYFLAVYGQPKTKEKYEQSGSIFGTI